MPFEIRIRLMKLGRNQVDLIPELKKCGIDKISPAELSVALKGLSQSPKSQNILSMSNEIVTRWEQERA